MDPAAAIEAAAMAHLKVIEEATASGDSDIQRFYSGSTVFLTGGSGFLGKQLVEKLFRSCDIKKVYMLLRAKKEKTMQERLVEMLEDPVFDAVKRKKPGFEDQIITVEGDISNIRLGISESAWNDLSEEVEVIFHVAATTRFDENIREATFINVRGTREALLLGKSCKKLKSYVHVSTAYSHATSMTRGGEVLERFHQSPVPPETLIQMAESIDKRRLDSITTELIEGWPNTYTFTKAVAEEQVLMASSQLPVCIVRPSIVIASYHEPFPGWLDMSCIFSASGMVVGSGLGLNHVMKSVKDTDLSLVPVDFVNNALITAGWEVGTRQHDTPRKTTIYNMVTSTKNKITSGKIKKYLNIAGDICPTPKAVWKSYVLSTPYHWMFLLLSYLLHYIPALIIDTILFIIGKETRFINLSKKVYKLSISLSYFMNNLHKMDDKNLTRLKQRLSEADRKIFNFDMTHLDWQEYVKIWCVGVRKYLLKDGLKDTEKAVQKQFWFGILNYIFLALYGYSYWFVLSYLFQAVFRLF